MILELRLAFRNLISAGIRTWLNVFVLSLTFVLIIAGQGLYDGMGDQSTQLKLDYEIAGGQFWAKGFDPFDPLTFKDSHQKIDTRSKSLIEKNKAVAILIQPASVYPKGRLKSVMMKGIDPRQTVLKFPSADLLKSSNYLPVLIGHRMAKSLDVKQGDVMTLRWRDHLGVFDAVEVQVISIMNVDVPTIDTGQIWMPLQRLQQMVALPNEATVITFEKDVFPKTTETNWERKDTDFLLLDITTMVTQKKVSSLILYVIMLFLALISIFDAQILSLFRRRKEIGTLMALGMTKGQVIRVFTFEGVLNGVFSIVIGFIYGAPLFIYSQKVGYTFPVDTDQFGMAVSSTLFPSYPLSLFVSTTVVILLVVALVSYYPTREIAKLKPTDAITGRKALF